MATRRPTCGHGHEPQLLLHSLRLIQFLQLLQLLQLLQVQQLAAAPASAPAVCGRPGRPINGTVSRDEEVPSPYPTEGYPAGAQVTYACVEGFVLFGDTQRTCLANGSWTGEVPLCDFNVGAGKRSLQSGTLWSYAPGLAVDGSPDTCSFTPRGPDPRWWQVHLGHKFNVIRVAVTISPGSLQEFTIYVIELLADNKALYKPCTTFKGVFKTHKAVFLCNDGLGHPGQFVYIRDDRKDDEYFGLCEVEVFAFRERTPCGPPGEPLHGSVTVGADTGQAQYSCARGYVLTGDAVHTCSSRGKWEGQEPRCVEVHCPDLPHPQNGEINFESPNASVTALTELVPGTVAKYRCNGGFTVRGNASRSCLYSGHWEGAAPACVRVNCGDPPEVPNARHTLLNTTALYSGIAVYTCDDGFRLSNGSADMVSTCEDTGTWRPVNITCVPVVAAQWEVIESSDRNRNSGRSLSYEVEATISQKERTQITANESSGLNSPLVMGLAIVAALLLIALLLLLAVFAVRRNYLTGPGSLNPLLRAPVKRPPMYDSGYLNNAAYIRERNYNDSMNNGSRTPVSSVYHNNLLRVSGAGNTENGAVNAENSSLSGSVNRLDEPPYERVRSRSEHSYETIRKANQQVPQEEDDRDSEEPNYPQEPNYERVPGDKGSLWYESVDKASVGYETVPANDKKIVTGSDLNACQIRENTNCNECKQANATKTECSIHKGKDPGYEKIKENDHQYETLKEKDPGYESLKEKNDPGYETMTKKSLLHAYETVKPKEQNDSGSDDDRSNDSTVSIPDILQDIEALEENVLTGSVPPEILALYAQVDKSKKKKKAPKRTVRNKSNNEDSTYTSIDESGDASPSAGVVINAGRPTPPPRPKGMAPLPLQAFVPSSSSSPSSASSIAISTASSNPSSILSTPSSSATANSPSAVSSTILTSPSQSSYTITPTHSPLHQTYSDSTIRISVPDVSSSRVQENFRLNKLSSCDDLTRPSCVPSEYSSPSGTLRPLPPIPRQ